MNGVKLFCKGFVLNLLVAAQIAASILCTVISAAVISKLYYYYNITRSADDAYAYMPEYGGVYYSGDSAIAKYVSSGEISLSRVRNELVWGCKSDVSDANLAYAMSEYKIDAVYTFGDPVSEIMRSQLKNGRWFTNIKDDGIIECVVISDSDIFAIGTVIDGAEFGIEYTDDKSIEFAVKNRYKFKIVGVCGADADVLSFNIKVSPAENLNLSNIFSRVDYGSEDFFESLGSRDADADNADGDRPNATLLCSSDAFCGDVLGCDDVSYTGDNALFEFAENVSDDRKVKILSDLKKEAGVVAIGDLRSRALGEARDKIMQYLPITLCFVAAFVVGAVCAALLGILKSKETFRVCFICGMSLKKGISVVLQYAFCQTAVALLMASLAWSAMSAAALIPWRQMLLGAHSALIAAAAVMLSYTLTVIASVPLVKKFHCKGVEV